MSKHLSRAQAMIAAGALMSAYGGYRRKNKGGRYYIDYAKKRKALHSQIRARGRKRLSYSYGKGTKQNVKQLKKRVTKLSQENEATMGDLIYRDIGVNDISTAKNSVAYAWVALNSVDMLKLVIAQLRYYDPTAPTNLVTANFSTGSYHKDVRFTSSHIGLILRSNYKVPVHVRAYLCRVKEDTSNDPNALMTSGVPDVSNLTASSMLIFPSDVPVLTDLWNLKLLKNRIVQPGQQCNVSYTQKIPFNYDPSLTDSHNLQYQRKYKGCGMLIRLNGLPAHDTTLDEQGIADVKMDRLFKRTFNVRYNAGANIKYVYGSDALTTFTNDAYVCNSDIAMGQIIGPI